MHNPEKLTEVFGPLVDLFNESIPEYQFNLEASRNYESFEEKLKNRELELALPNPYQALIALKYGYQVFAKMGDDKNFRGIIVVRRDSGIKRVGDLKNKKISYPASTALAATMLPQFYLHQNGLDIFKDLTNMYVGSQESAILNVYLKESDAGCTWPPPWISFVKNNPEKAKELEIKWETQNLVNNAFIISDEIAPLLKNKLRDILINLHKSPQGQKILRGMELSKFELANEQSYKPVKDFIEQFNKEIRRPGGLK